MLKQGFYFVAGLFLIGLYLAHIAPPQTHPGYAGDLCFTEVTRHEIHHELLVKNNLSFETEHLRYPFGSSLAFMPFGLEKDLFGGFFVEYFPNAKFLYLYVVFSFLFSYFFGGLIVRALVAHNSYWLISAGLVLFNVPRHFKFWHHYEFLSLHWVHIGLLLDALVWQRFVVDKKWDLSLELWRGLALLGMLGTAPYFWGPLCMAYLLVRGAMLYLARKPHQPALQIVWPKLGRTLYLQVGLSLAFALTILFWFLPLVKQVWAHGTIPQHVGYTARIEFFLRPLWLDQALSLLNLTATWNTLFEPFTTPETVVTVGWTLLLPFGWLLYRLRKTRHLFLVTPFLIFLGIGLIYTSAGGGGHWQELIRTVTPLMSFFRVASRWGILLPVIISVCLLLGWRHFHFRSHLDRRRPILIAAFLGVVLLEGTALMTPTNFASPLSSDAQTFFSKIRSSQGSALLDLPFCVVGGNGMCLETCPFYDALVGQCLQAVHGKKVFSIYQARLTEEYCSDYQAKPYEAWMTAWKSNRCFTTNEVADLCTYLEQDPEISNVLVYTGIWTAAGDPECLSTLIEHLGPPLDKTVVPTKGWKESTAEDGLSEVLRFSGRCLDRPKNF